MMRADGTKQYCILSTNDVAIPMRTIRLVASPLRWTQHARDKMRFYALSEPRLKRVLKHPTRVEHGIAPNTTALMQPTNVKHTSEIWLMYTKRRGQLVIITAWRYPGKSPVRGDLPIPMEIRRTLTDVIDSLTDSGR